MKPSSIFTQVAGLAGLVLVAAFFVGVVLTLALPAPDRGRLTVLEMAESLKAERSAEMRVEWARVAPEGHRSPLLEAALAEAMGRSPDDVRASWRYLPGAAVNAGQNVMSIDGRDVLVSTSANGFALIYGDDAKLNPDTFVPLFNAAVRLDDGSWRVAKPLEPARQAWQARLLIAFTGAALVLAIPTWWISRRIARPVEELERVATSTRFETPSRSVPSGPREVRAAAVAMYDMHARLVEQASERLRMMAALAHDLRTPITALRLRAEEATPKLRQRLLPDLKRMADMIDDCLDLATLGVQPILWAPVRLDLLVHECCGSRPHECITYTSITPVTVLTDQRLLCRAVGNLVDNAVRYGERATVSLQIDRDHAVISVEDDGPGIPEDQLARLLRPFETLDPARSRELGGVGLGLSIVRDIANQLDSELVVTNGSVGLTVRLRIPMRTADPPSE